MFRRVTVFCFSFLAVFFLSQSLYAWHIVNGFVSAEDEGTDLLLSGQIQVMDKEPVFTVSETVHDFGLIKEEDREAIHVFKVKNTGDAPLIIKQVQSSCGCAEPIWTLEPIAPGKEGEVVIIYNSENRPGPFKKNIMVYTNEKKYRQRLTIMGDVIPKATQLLRAFDDTVGTIQMERKEFLFYTVRPEELSKQEIWIQNFSNEVVSLSLENLPAYLDVEVPEKLEPNKPQRLKMTVDGNKLRVKGHHLDHFTWKAKSASGSMVKKDIPVVVNLIDDFSTLSPTERTTGAQIKLSSTFIEFGKVKKTGFLGMGSKPATRQFTITNEGKTPLILHSVSIDDAQVEIVDLRKNELQPGESINVDILIYPKKLKASLDSEIHIVCNDASGPVRQIRITAEK